MRVLCACVIFPSLSVTCDRSVVFSGSSGFLHQLNWPPRYNWTIVESGVKQHKTKPNLLYFFFWPLCWLFFDMRILITPSVSSNSSYNLCFRSWCITKFNWWRKPEEPEKTTDLSQVTDKLGQITHAHKTRIISLCYSVFILYVCFTIIIQRFIHNTAKLKINEFY
jgi:hypothetical protein